MTRTFDKRTPGRGFVRRFFSFKPGPYEPAAELANQWWFEHHYRPWLWPIVWRGFCRRDRVVVFSAGWVMVTVVDVVNVENGYEEEDQGWFCSSELRNGSRTH